MLVLDGKQEDRERRAKRQDNPMLSFYDRPKRCQDNGQRADGDQRRREIHGPMTAWAETKNGHINEARRLNRSEQPATGTFVTMRNRGVGKEKAGPNQGNRIDDIYRPSPNSTKLGEH